MMTATVSLSKGVFSFKNRKSRKKAALTGWCDSLLGNDTRQKELTLQSYQHCLSSINQFTEEFLAKIHREVFKDLVASLKTCRRERTSINSEILSHFKKDMPAACLVTGVNMPDHDTIFDNLVKQLKNSISPYIARLAVSDCSNIKLTVEKLVQLIMKNRTYEFNEGMEEDGFDSDYRNTLRKSLEADGFNCDFDNQKSLKKYQCNMTVLASWYDECIATKRILNKKKSKDVQFLPPLIVIVEEVEGVIPRVLQDLILICSEYNHRIPFVFILGVSTSPLAIHRSLNQDASACIALETFQAKPSSIVLSQIIEELMMTSLIPFQIGGRVFKLLLDIFLYHDLSVNNFISKFKYCLLTHMMYSDFSFLCCAPRVRESIILSLDEGTLAKLKEVPSFAKYLSGLPKEEAQNLQTDKLKKRICSLFSELESWNVDFCCLVRVLHAMFWNLPHSPLGKHIREVLAICLFKPIKESEEFQAAWSLLLVMGKEDLLERIEKSLQVLKDIHKSSALVKFASSLSDLYGRLKNIENTIEISEKTPKNIPVQIKPTDRFHLMEKLLGGAKQKSKNPYEILRSDILSLYEHWFIAYLKPPSKPFHEIIFFDSVSSVKYHLLGHLRTTLTTGLKNPQKYLQCSCCQLEKDSDISPSLPDLSILYKLHLECGTYINIYDWMQAFIAVVSNEESSMETHENKKRKKSVDEKLQARFAQSMSELQFLGFIIPTKRKTDHVKRLTWGAC